MAPDRARLAAALDAYDRSEQTVSRFPCPASLQTMNARYADLISASRRCGYAPNLRETCHEWAKRTVGFRQGVEIGRAGW